MLREAIEATGIDPDTAASLLGIPRTIFKEWLADQRPVPQSVLGLLSTIIGVPLMEGKKDRRAQRDLAEITPAIWFRFRGEQLVDEDREYVFLIRKLGYLVHELEEITNLRARGWSSLFQDIRREIDKGAPPRIQGRVAAGIYRQSSGLSVGATGIGEVLRANLRSMGLLVIETPIPESNLEGCCFSVGAHPSERPCVFANNHHSTWYRRNFVIAHELAHAIFDAESEFASLDFKVNDKSADPYREERADAFALELLVPKQVLYHVAQARGFSWSSLGEGQLAQLVADTYVEKLDLLQGALVADLITPAELGRYSSFDISELLPRLSEHALTTGQFISKHVNEAEKWLNKRTTTIPTKPLELPVPYIKAVTACYQAGTISSSKAAEMLMIDQHAFADRFGDLELTVQEPSED